MDEYVWISKCINHPVYVKRVHPVLAHLAADYDVRITVAGPAHMSGDEYIGAIDDAVARGVAGIMLVGWDDKRAPLAVARAIDNGIPVVTINSDIAGSRRLGFAGTDWRRMGGAMADELAARIGGAGSVSLIGMPGLESVQTGFRGFKDRMQAYSNIRVLETETMTYADELGAREAVSRYIARHDDLVGIAAFDVYGGLGTAAALVDVGRQNAIKLVCIDAGAPQIEAIRNGTIDASFNQRREMFTSLAFQMVYAFNHGSAATGFQAGPINAVDSVTTGFTIITSNNLDTYQADINLDEAYRRYDVSQRLALASGMLDNSAQLALAANPDGIIVYANPATLRFLDTDENSLRGKTIDSIFSFTADHRRMIAQCRTDGTTAGFEWTVGNKRDHDVPFQFSISPLRSGESITGLVITASNISHLKRIENQLKRESNFITRIMDTSPVGIVVVDQDGVIVFTNPGMAKILGEEIGQLIGRKVLEGPWKVTTVDGEPVLDQDMPYVRIWHDGQAVRDCQYHLVWPDGHRHIVSVNVAPLYDDSGRPDAVIAIVEDITERRRAEKALREAEHEKEVILDSLVEHVVYQDTDMKVLWANKAACNSLDVVREEIIGRHCYELWEKQKLPCADCPVAMAMKTGRAEHIEKTTPDGRSWFIRGAPVTDRDGKIIGGIELTLDITERKRAEEALRRSENTSRAILNAMPDMIFQISEDGVFQNCQTPDMDRLLMPPDLFLGKSIHDILPHPLNKITAENIERALLSKAVQIYEYSIDIKGKRRHYESRMTAIDDDSVLTIIRDITIRKAAEEALRESENRFRVVFMTSPDSISISSPDDGTIVDVNESFATLSGYRRDEVIGRSALNLDIWNDPADREKMIRQMQTDGKVDNFEAIFRVKNNQLRTALLSARIIRLQGRDYMLLVARDVEDLKRAERALRESEERFRTIIETASDPIYVKNRQLHYITVNPSFARLFNLAPEYFAGKSYDDLFPDNDTEHNRKIEQRVLNGEIVAEESMRIIAGKEQYFHIISAPMRTAAGDIIGICGIARDITEIRNLREYAARAQRLETAGRIAGQVAHDFNNLLGPLIAYPGVIRDELPDNHEVISFLDDMEKAAEQMADINQQLLTLGRRGHYIQEPLNLNEIIRQVSELLQPYPEGVTLTTDLPDTIMNILGGSAQIYRIISNLAINAFDAMPGGGELHIATENCYVDEQVGEFRRIPIGEYVRITVSDTGHGIAEENLSMIFDPFFTTKKADRKRGSGLGLSVVHAVVEDHHGYIDVESRPGKGTIFRLYFPITRDKIDQAEAESIVGGDENIMVIDDDKIQRDVTLKLLEKLGYGAVGADGGEKALAILKTAPQDLLILDMIMPGMDGLETYRRVLEINRRQRAILVSGYAESDRVKRAHKLGAGEFLRKPITLKALATTIRKELDRE